jgi:hypothetical protein
MLRAYIKRIIEVDVQGENAKEVLEKAKLVRAGETVSDTFLVVDENEIIQEKEKVLYKSKGVSFGIA